MELTERKIIARRAALELEPNSVVNLGIGMPEGVANVASEEKIVDLMTLTAEPGVIGGMPAGGLNFGAAVNAQAIIDQPYQFDFYDGGGLDVAFLGLAQADQRGQPQRQQVRPALGRAPAASSTSARTPRRWSSSARSRRAVSQIAVEDGRLRIVREGKPKKFVREVEHRTFSGAYAVKREQPVLYVTERCVFELTHGWP